MTNKKIWVPAVLLLFIAGMGAGYYFLGRTGVIRAGSAPGPVAGSPQEAAGDFMSISLYYPSGSGLKPVTRKLPGRSSRSSIAEAVIEEFFKTPAGGEAVSVPRDVRLLGIYRDSADIIYVDLSDEFRRNFQVDSLSEYLLLKGLYESLTANLQELKDVKVLIDGKEAETAGGHIFLKYGLKNTVSGEYKADVKPGNE